MENMKFMFSGFSPPPWDSCEEEPDRLIGQEEQDPKVYIKKPKYENFKTEGHKPTKEKDPMKEEQDPKVYIKKPKYENSKTEGHKPTKEKDPMKGKKKAEYTNSFENPAYHHPGYNRDVPIKLKVPLCCYGCEERMESALIQLEGVDSVLVDSEMVTITGNVDPAKALEQVRKVSRESRFWSETFGDGEEKTDEAETDDEKRYEDTTKKDGVMTVQKILSSDQHSILGEAVEDKVKARKEIEDLQKKEHSSGSDALMKVRSSLLILKGKLNLKTAEFITEINNGRDSGYFVSKAWMLSLDEHEDQTLTSVLRQTGYLEIYQTDTTVFYEKINEAVQVSNSCNENIDLGGRDTNKAVASRDNEHKIGYKKHFRLLRLAIQLKRSNFLDPEVSTSSFQNKMQPVPVQNDQTAFVDSPKSLLDKGKMPLATSNERLESFKRAINDSSLDNYSVSTQWISTLSDQERENLNFALSKAGYLQINRTSVTTYFERLQGHVRNNPNNESESPSTLQNTSIVRGAESSRAFEGSGGLLADDWQRPKIDNKGSSAVTNAIRERHKQETTCSCYPQHLTVSCTPEPSPSSASQGEQIFKYSTRQAVGDSHVTMPRKREVQLVRTGADKRISMRTVYCCGLSDYNEDSISLKVSAYTSLTCCLKSDSDDKKVRIEFSTIGGEVKVEDNVNPKTNTVVLRSVRCNVDACIIHCEGTDDFEPISLYVQEADGQCPWRRVLQTYELFDDNGQPRRQDVLLWMNLAESHPKNSEPGSRTLELQCHVKNRIHYDLDRCCHDAHALQFAERDPVILEGDIFEDLQSNILLELNVRYQVVISYNEPRLPKPGQKFVPTTRVDKTLDFECVLEFRTRKLSSLGSPASH